MLPVIYDHAGHTFDINGKHLSRAPTTLPAVDVSRKIGIELLAGVYQAQDTPATRLGTSWCSSAFVSSSSDSAKGRT